MALTKEQEIEYLLLLEAEAKKKEIDKNFKPQQGPQTAFLNSQADITIFGGAAGGGKTYALLLRSMLNINVKGFTATIFRRNSTQIMNEGGLWSDALKLMPLKGAIPVVSPKPTMKFPSGARITFQHLQLDNTVYDFQGAAIALIAFDEMTHFTKAQIMYMLSRNRSVCGVVPKVIGTCNPDPNSFVAELIEWYIDDDGFPVKEKSGILRYFLVIDDEFKWGDSREELSIKYNTDPKLIKSFTFIASSIFDNKILLEQNPEYLANLNALNTVEKGRLLYGNWRVKESAGMYLPKAKIEIVNQIPGKIRKFCRAYDLAATIPTPSRPSPDATAGPLMGKLDDGRYIILDLLHGRWTSNDVKKKVLETAKFDKNKFNRVINFIPQDPGAAGKSVRDDFIKLLSGYIVRSRRMTGDKVTRCLPLSSQWQAGNILMLAGDWNEILLNECDSFPEGKHDDIVDGLSDCFEELQTGKSWSGLIS
ncbi:MAG: hypothetical protein K0Q53_85 [Massilibacillus sp.]|nr:hypothetical protein [Massilibacillus sp.]